jgi:hypothetical protein
MYSHHEVSLFEKQKAIKQMKIDKVKSEKIRVCQPERTTIYKTDKTGLPIIERPNWG